MPQNKVYLSFGRHERYGTDTPILREDMLAAYLSGQMLYNILPLCETVYHSPLERAVCTAKFEALGLKCTHLLENDSLEESATSFVIQRLVNAIIENSSNEEHYYHLVTHLPVIEKLGLPFLAAGEICLLTADSWQEMLSENFSIQVFKKPEISAELWQRLNLTYSDLTKMNVGEIYALISAFGKELDMQK